jgi:hypothetical protein
MTEKIRLDVALPIEQHNALQALAAETGFRPGALARLAVVQFLERSDLLLSGRSSAGHGDLEKFVAELRADARMAPVADRMADAFRAVDLEADASPDAVCLMAAVSAICRTHRPLVDRLRALLDLVSIEGPITIPRDLLTNQPTHIGAHPMETPEVIAANRIFAEARNLAEAKNKVPWPPP